MLARRRYAARCPADAGGHCFGRDGGAALYEFLDEHGRAWPIQYQYDTRKPKPATDRRPAFEPPRTGFVIVAHREPTGFYGEVVGTVGELRAEWRRWRVSLFSTAPENNR